MPVTFNLVGLPAGILATVAVRNRGVQKLNGRKGMKTSKYYNAGVWHYINMGLVAAIVTVGVAACGHIMMMVGGTERPLADEFGMGPRTSAQGLYNATLLPAETLQPRTMQTLQVVIKGSDGTAIDGAAITIDGGMPEHGHGLPTRPRVTSYLGDGIYEIEGVRFNMGGWWEIKLAVDSPLGSDTVTFNLDI